MHPGLSFSCCCFVIVFLMQLKEKVFQRQQGSYILTVEAGRQLLLSADNRAEVALQAELTEIQEQWKRTSVCLEEQRKDLATLLKVSSHFRCSNQFQPQTYTLQISRQYQVIGVSEAKLGCNSRWVSLAGLGAVWKGNRWIAGETSSVQAPALAAFAWSPRGPSSWTNALQGINLTASVKLNINLLIDIHLFQVQVFESEKSGFTGTL